MEVLSKVDSQTRRQWLRAALLLPAFGALSACGFKPRGQVAPASTLADAQGVPFEAIWVDVPAQTPLGAALRRELRAGLAVELLDRAAPGAARLQVLGERREEGALSIDAQGRVREIELRSWLTFQLLDSGGRVLLAPVELAQRRDLGFSDSALLATEAQKTVLYREMQLELVRQLVRRIQAVRAAE